MKIKLIANHYLLVSGKGFTLIEILVVFSLTVILSGIGFAAFSSYNKSQQLNQTANNAKLMISQARSNSLSVVKKTQDPNGNSIDCGTQKLNGYYVQVVDVNSPLPDELRLFIDCDTVPPAPTLVKNIVLPDGLHFLSQTTCSIIRFESLTSSLLSAPCDITVGWDASQFKTVTIDSGGNASIQ